MKWVEGCLSFSSLFDGDFVKPQMLNHIAEAHVASLYTFVSQKKDINIASDGMQPKIRVPHLSCLPPGPLVSFAICYHLNSHTLGVSNRLRLFRATRMLVSRGFIDKVGDLSATS